MSYMKNRAILEQMGEIQSLVAFCLSVPPMQDILQLMEVYGSHFDPGMFEQICAVRRGLTIP